MGEKPDDWRTVSLCKGCHTLQHEQGEPSFWRYRFGENQWRIKVEALIDAFCEASPKSYDIRQERRGDGHD